MKIYTLSILSITDGVLDYSVIEQSFTNREDAKKKAASLVKSQASIWEVEPTVFRKVKGHLSQIQLKHPTHDVVKVYSLQETELV